MGEGPRQLRWGVEKRLEFIEFRLFWEGAINRSDLVEQFDVSVPQASNDLSQYDKLAPQNMVYDKSGKSYVRSATFRPVLTEPTADEFLARLNLDIGGGEATSGSWLANPPTAESLPTLHRSISVDVLRELLATIRDRRSLEIQYQSMNPNHPDPLWRWITPHAFANDGFRWHVRAYCHRDSKFKDFLLSRILAVGKTDEPKASQNDDDFWNQTLQVSLIPNPKLTPAQQRVISVDYGMQEGKVSLPVRKALLYYFKKRLRLDVADAIDRPQETPVVVENIVDFNAAIRDATS